MAWIRTVAPGEARGKLAQIYEAAVSRAGRVFGILRVMSLNPTTLESSMELYKRAMFGRSELTRAQRELLAVVVSRANDCHY
ncbi:MAG: carboxymuconolactone decarboxylase family protein [Planctomycetota bacterium]